MKIEQIYTGCLAQGAYYIESNGEAVIIDPLRETKPYLEKLATEGAQLKYIFETHFHADFVSGHLDLAEKTGATIIYGPKADTDYAIHNAKDGELLKIGNLTFKVLHTPGHTLESTTYLLRDESGADYAIFTGDTLFLGDVGRPDLAIKQGEMTKEDLAALLFDSLRNKILPLADEVIVYPGHGAGSACGKNLSKETFGYLGNQKETNYALRQNMTKAEFVKEVTAGLAPAPQYFAKNALLNKVGYTEFETVLKKGAVPLTPDYFELKVKYEEALVLDVRSREEFSEAHIPGAIFIGLDGSFAPWVGALITDIHQPIVLVTRKGREEETVTRLARVGYDNTLGYLDGGMTAWIAKGNLTESIVSISAITFADELIDEKSQEVLDVRKPTEFLSQHLQIAHNFPLDYINQNMNKLNKQTTYFIHCAGGYRSMIAASILKARGFENLINIAGGWTAIEKTTVSKTDFTCPTIMEQEVIDAAVASVV